MAAWRKLYQRWLARRLPAVSDVTLTQRQIFIFPNRRGLYFLLLALLLFIGGINYENNLMMGFSFLLFSLFCVAILHTFRNLSGLRIKVGGYSPAFVGAQGSVRLHLAAGKKGHAALHLFWHRNQQQHLDLFKGEEVRLDVPLVLARRGWNKPSDRLVIESYYPLGLIRAWSLLALDVRCLSWPKPLPGGECPASGGNEQEGHDNRGTGTDEFAELKEYQAGDSLQRVDWKTYASGKGLFVRHFDDPAAGRVWLEWDLLAGMDVESRLSRLSYWAQVLEQEGKPWGLNLPNEQLAPDNGVAHLQEALNRLALFGEEG